jgi:REP element-mobilizing transposase RayT
MTSQALEYKIFYRQHLPHIQPPGATFFLTFRLANSIPTVKLVELQEEARATERRLAQICTVADRQREAVLAAKRQFARWDAMLDLAACGPKWLTEPAIARLVADALHFQHNRTADLDSFTIMSNHVHVVLTPLEKSDGSYHSLARILHSIKSFTSNQANRILGLEGAFWQHESYDHYVRDPEELLRIRRYVLNNPVKAGLIDSIENWPWSYSKFGLS